MLAPADELLQLTAFFLRQPPCPYRLGQPATPLSTTNTTAVESGPSPATTRGRRPACRRPG